MRLQDHIKHPGIKATGAALWLSMVCFDIVLCILVHLSVFNMQSSVLYSKRQREGASMIRESLFSPIFEMSIGPMSCLLRVLHTRSLAH